jgi:hypothetical protein
MAQSLSQLQQKQRRQSTGKNNVDETNNQRAQTTMAQSLSQPQQ